MKVKETPFRTTHLGVHVSRNVLKHNAYTAGWEHGAADHRAESAYWETMRELGLISIYGEGIDDGRKARSAAWKKAATLRDDPGEDD